MNNKNYLKLLQSWKCTKDFKSRELIILETTKLIQSLVKKFNMRANTEDLFQEGVIGVINACDTFDEKKNINFLTYAKSCAIFNILDYLRRDNVIPKGSKTRHNYNLSLCKAPECHSEALALAKAKKLPYKTVIKYATMANSVYIDTFNDMSGEDDVFRNVAAMEELEKISEKMSKVKIRDQQIFLSEFLNEKEQKTIASDFGITRQRVDQIVKKAQNSFLSIREN